MRIFISYQPYLACSRVSRLLPRNHILYSAYRAFLYDTVLAACRLAHPGVSLFTAVTVKSQLPLFFRRKLM